jgi:hypothetical protein
MGKEVLASFKPLVEFFSKGSTGKSTPGDVLDQELAGIRGIITTLRASQTGGKSVAGAAASAPLSGAAASGVAWGLGSMALGSTGGIGGQSAAPRTLSGSSGATLSAIKDLEDCVKSIEDQLQAKPVLLGGITFKSQSLTSAWLGANAPEAVGRSSSSSMHTRCSVWQRTR